MTFAEAGTNGSRGRSPHGASGPGATCAASAGRRRAIVYRTRYNRSRCAFTLIEMMVVVSIIAVLIGILAPVLGAARRASQDTLCLANLKQIGVAWGAYFSANRTYPSGQMESSDNGRILPNHMQTNWGGNNFQRAQGAGGWVTGERPLNPYVGSERLENGRNEVFRCPRDTGLYYSSPNADNARYAQEVTWDGSTVADEDRDTMFGQQGTSYRANDWIWAKPGSLYGFFAAGTRDRWRYYGSNRPEDAFSPSRFVVTGDHGVMWILRADLPGRILGWGVWHGWWHDEERGNLQFLDGSARKVKSSPGDGACAEWSFWMDERLHRPKSWVAAFSQGGTPRERMP